MGDVIESDRISKLPDDILISIISRLALREATKTCIVSHRWRYLHTYSTGLTFPPFAVNISAGSKLVLEEEKRRFLNHVKMIDGVLGSHRSRAVKELKLHMDKIMEGANFEKWLEFALTKLDQIEIISMHATFCTSLPCSYSYSLGLSKLKLHKIQSFKSLKQLCLHGIQINDQDFDILISNFVGLEDVSIRQVQELRKVSIVGHPKLKRVEISVTTMGSLESVEIRDVVNLLSLCLGLLSPGCVLQLENIPKLTEFYSCEYCRIHLLYEDLFLHHLPSCIRNQLQLLHISTTTVCLGYSSFDLSFQFVNIKQLELEVEYLGPTVSHYKYYRLIRACPSIQKLKMKFVWPKYKLDRIRSKGFGRRLLRDVYDHRRSVFKLSPNLEKLEMEGYVGSPQEFEFASLIIDHATNLQQIIVVACDASKSIHRKASAHARSDFRKLAPPPLHVQII